MTESTPLEDRYDQRMDVLFPASVRFDVSAIARGVEHPWFNQTLCQVNDSVVRLGVIKGEYHWHAHEDDDEFFYVVEGELLIDLEGDRTVSLRPGQGFVVARGHRHRTRAPERTVILMVETAEIDPKGTPMRAPES